MLRRQEGGWVTGAGPGPGEGWREDGTRQPAGPQAALWVGVAQSPGHGEGQAVIHEPAAQAAPPSAVS